MSTLDEFINSGTSRTASEVNEAMGRVYGYMGLAVVVSMLVSMFVGTNPELVKFFFTGIMHYVVIFAPLLYIFFVPILLNSGISKEGAMLVLYSFAALMGLSFAVIFAVYTMASVFTAFMGSGVLFGVMSFYGYFTKKSLDSLGQYMFVGLIAIVIASIINIFIGSTVMQMVISAIAIIIFLGLTAYDTQTLKNDYLTNGEVYGFDSPEKSALFGALSLYLNFVNIFQMLLNLLGEKE